jgi:hypothetical protein
MTNSNSGLAVAAKLGHCHQGIEALLLLKAALNAADDYWPAGEQPERIGDPIDDRRMRVDLIAVYDVDIICQGDSKKLGRDRAEKVPVRHPAGFRALP